MPSFLKILRSTSLVITVVCTWQPSRRGRQRCQSRAVLITRRLSVVHFFVRFLLYVLFRMSNSLFWWLWSECSPLPIPNREVKPHIADDTALVCGKVGRRQSFIKSIPGGMLFFLLSPAARHACFSCSLRSRDLVNLVDYFAFGGKKRNGGQVNFFVHRFCWILYSCLSVDMAGAVAVFVVFSSICPSFPCSL